MRLKGLGLYLISLAWPIYHSALVCVFQQQFLCWFVFTIAAFFHRRRLENGSRCNNWHFVSPQLFAYKRTLWRQHNHNPSMVEWTVSICIFVFFPSVRLRHGEYCSWSSITWSDHGWLSEYLTDLQTTVHHLMKEFGWGNIQHYSLFLKYQRFN